MLKKKLKTAAIIIIFCVLGLWSYLLLQKPSHNRAWRVDNAKIASAEIEGKIVTLSNIRNWRYNEQGPTSNDWISGAYDLSQLKDTWFIMEPFSTLRAIGHGMLMFDFSDGKTILISVEAKKETDEKFSTWKGVLKQFELIYLWGTQEDFLVRRAVVQKHPLRMHRLKIPHDTMSKLFLALAQETNEIKAQPKFYNTILHNCVNKLAHAANEANPGSVPFTASYILAGYADKHLYESGLLHGKSTWEEQEEVSYIDEYIRNNYLDPSWPQTLRQKTK